MPRLQVKYVPVMVNGNAGRADPIQMGRQQQQQMKNSQYQTYVEPEQFSDGGIINGVGVNAFSRSKAASSASSSFSEAISNPNKQFVIETQEELLDDTKPTEFSFKPQNYGVKYVSG